MSRQQHYLRARMVRIALVILVLIAVSVMFIYVRYRLDMNDAKERLASGSHVVQTPCGLIEYNEVGVGKIVLSVHGAGGGWDQGLHISSFMGEGVRVIAPSRFGYLNTPYPGDPSAVAQADAYACLLDRLDLERASVVAFSAGGPSALQFAIRYPHRVDALVMVSAISDASLVDQRPVDPSNDPVLSALLTDFVRGEFDLGRIIAPTLVIHAMDDTFVPFAHGQYTAARIPNSRFAQQEFGGHFVYVKDAVLREIRTFIEQHGRTP